MLTKILHALVIYLTCLLNSFDLIASSHSSTIAFLNNVAFWHGRRVALFENRRFGETYGINQGYWQCS
jgi:hypothetical protein